MLEKLTFHEVFFGIGGGFISLKHSSNGQVPLVIKDSLFMKNKRGYIDIFNSDLNDDALKVVQIENTLFEEN